MIGKLNILFFLYRSKVNRTENMPVYCRITLNGQRKQFATGCCLKQVEWDSKNAKHNGISAEAKHINSRLRAMQKNLLRAYGTLARAHAHFDVNQLYDQYAGKVIDIRTLLGVFDHHIAQIRELVGKDYSVATYHKFILIKGHVQGFLKVHFRLDDYLLSQLNLGFLHDFDHYLKAHKGQNQNTVNKTIERVKKIVKIAVAHGWLSHDPFALYRKRPFVKEVVYLDSQELERLERHPFLGKLIAVRDIFLFSCYTGLAYQELSQLKNVHLKRDRKGFLWIEMIRQKTKRPISVLLLPKALDILQIYEYLNNDGLLLPVISNQKLNVYLKELGAEIGIHKHLTHHVARKTFASTVLLNNDIPIDVASFLLGHSRVSTTEEFYAKVQKERVISHLQKSRIFN